MGKKITLNLCLVFLLGLFISVKSQLDSDINQILDEFKGNDKNSNSLDLSPTQPVSNKNEFEIPKTGIDCKDECVPFYQCNDGIINNNGRGLIDIRSNDGPCGNALLTCCKLDNVNKNRNVQLSNPNKEFATSHCGFRNPNGVGFGITGTTNNEAQFAEFPWVVSLIKNALPTDLNPRPSCGGTLIHPQAVLTAAHCVVDQNARYQIRAGEWDINRTVEPFPVQVTDVAEIQIHKDFFYDALLNDIAFLYLKSPVKLAENINTLCLPPQDYIHKYRCYSTGWGKDRFGKKGKYHVIMKKIDLPVVNNELCESQLRKTRLGRFFELHPSFMCAGGERGKDACNGDGGSPLVCPLDDEQNRYYHAGIVAWGIGCGDENVPGVYTDITQFRSWIDQQMKQYQLEIGYYLATEKVHPRKL